MLFVVFLLVFFLNTDPHENSFFMYSIYYLSPSLRRQFSWYVAYLLPHERTDIIFVTLASVFN